MGSWSSAGDLNAGVYQQAGAGIYNATISFGGENRVLGDTSLATTAESYNGTAWTVLENALNTARKSLGGVGSQAAAICFGGSNGVNLVKTEEYNGTIWEAGGDLGAAISNNKGAGTQTAALSFAGYDGSNVNKTEEYNGTTWSAGGDLISAISSNAGVGEQTAALSFGGYNGINGDKTEEYNGTTWSAGGDLVNNIERHAGGGEQTAAISFGGDYGELVQAVTEEYNGTAWTEGGDLNTARFNLAGAGTKSLGLSFGGFAFGANALVTTESYSITYGQHKGISGIDGGLLFDGKTIIGDRTNGKLYYLDMDTYTDNGETIKRTRRTQIINKQRVNVIHNKIEVEFEPGVGIEDGDTPEVTLKWSDDGGQTFNDGKTVSIGEYEEYEKRAVFRALGKSRNRIYELTTTAPVKIVMIGAYGNLKPCKF